MSLVNVAKFGELTIGTGGPVQVTVTWPGQIIPSKWISACASVSVDIGSEVDAVQIVNQGTVSPIFGGAYEFTTLVQAQSSRSSIVQFELIGMIAVDSTF
jgi:hypothetical protein